MSAGTEHTTDELYCYHPSWTPEENGRTCGDCGKYEAFKCAHCGRVRVAHGTWGHDFVEPAGSIPLTQPSRLQPKHTHEDLFPWSWEAPEVHRTFECDRCGAAVANTDTHLAWHNGEDF